MDLSQFNRMPPVSAAMTPFPHFVERKDSVVRIEQIMSDPSRTETKSSASFRKATCAVW